MHIVFTHDSPCNESGEQSIQAKVVTALWETLEKRTYFVSVLNDRPYNDEHIDSKARQCFRAAMYCMESNWWREAFEWYKAGHEEFCGKQDFCVQYDAHSDVSVHYNFHDNEWQVFVETWFNTMYGSAHKWLQVGYLDSAYGINLDDKALAVRQQCWDAMIAERKAVIVENEKFKMDFTYDEE
jgi:hypothetical protein